jgi:hypothetical protein
VEEIVQSESIEGDISQQAVDAKAEIERLKIAVFIYQAAGASGSSDSRYSVGQSSKWERAHASVSVASRSTVVGETNI